MDSGTAGLVGVFLGAVIAAATKWVEHKFASGRDARYLATVLSVQLERLVIACAEVATDCGEPDAQGNMSPRVQAPELRLELIQGNWRALSPELMHAVHLLPYKLDLASAAASAAYENDMPPDWDDFYETRQLEYARVGLEVDRVASDLSRNFKYSRPGWPGWNPVVTLASVIDGIDVRRSVRESALEVPRENAPSQGLPVR